MKPKSKREAIEAAAAADRFYASMAGVEPRAQDLLNALDPKRKYTPSDPNSPHLERNIKKAIVKALRAHPAVAQVEVNVSGRFIGANGDFVYTGGRGKPDLSIKMRNGTWGLIEVKRKGEQPSPVQQQRIDTALRNGAAFAFVGHDPDYAVLIINSL